MAIIFIRCHGGSWNNRFVAMEEENPWPYLSVLARNSQPVMPWEPDIIKFDEPIPIENYQCMLCETPFGTKFIEYHLVK